YPDYEFTIPVRTEGDCYARYLVRMAELEQSLRICNQAVGRIEPKGPFRVDDRKVAPPPKYEISRPMAPLIPHFQLVTEGLAPPPGEVYQRIESPREELGFYVVSDGSNKPYPWHARTPSFANIQVMPLILRGGTIADTV